MTILHVSLGPDRTNRLPPTTSARPNAADLVVDASPSELRRRRWRGRAEQAARRWIGRAFHVAAQRHIDGLVEQAGSRLADPRETAVEPALDRAQLDAMRLDLELLRSELHDVALGPVKEEVRALARRLEDLEQAVALGAAEPDSTAAEPTG